jgi:hypothetical protein
LWARWQAQELARSRSGVADAVADEELSQLEDGLGIPRGSLTDAAALPVSAAAPHPYDPGSNGADQRVVLEEELGPGPWSLPAEARRVVEPVPPVAPNVPRTGARTVTDAEVRRLVPGSSA